MFNLIKADLYKLKKSTSIKVLFMLLLMYYILVMYNQKNKKKIVFYGILLGIYFLIYIFLIAIN